MTTAMMMDQREEEEQVQKQWAQQQICNVQLAKPFTRPMTDNQSGPEREEEEKKWDPSNSVDDGVWCVCTQGITTEWLANYVQFGRLVGRQHGRTTSFGQPTSIRSGRKTLNWNNSSRRGWSVGRLLKWIYRNTHTHTRTGTIEMG